MPVEREYLEYVGFFCVSILAASGAYLIDINRPFTYIGFLLAPLAFGYSAYVSRNGFRKASIASLMTLFLVGSKPVVSVIAIIVAFGVPLISAFSSGDSFKAYFGTVAVPLLISGLLVGAGVYTKVNYDQDAKENFKGFVADTAGEQAEIAMKASGLRGDVEDKQLQLMETTSNASIARTAQVLRSNMTTLNPEQKRNMALSFEYAQNTVPESISEQAASSAENKQADISEKVSKMVSAKFSDKYLLAIIPVVGMILYSLNPFVGLLTGIFAVLISHLSKRIEF